MEMQNLIAVESAPAKLDANFDALRQHLETELERYDIVVSSDTVKGAKELATELNKTAQTIDRRRKDEVAKVSEPIRAFDDQMKALVTMCKDGRTRITEQVKVYEDKTRYQARDLMEARRAELFDEHEVKNEFRQAEFDDLIKLTAVTAKGNLTKATSDELEYRVREDRDMQDMVERRLLELENASYKAGLSAPLTRSHVEHFLRSVDEEYAVKLEALIESEIQREHVAQQRMRERMEAEQARKEAQAAAQAEREARRQANELPANQGEPPTAAPVPNAPVPESQAKPMCASDGETAWRVTATFELTTGDGIQAEAVESRLRTLIKAAGITSLVRVEAKAQNGMDLIGAEA